MAQIEIKLEAANAEEKSHNLEGYKDVMNEIYALSNSYYEILAPTGYAFDAIEPIMQDHDLSREKAKLQDLFDLEVAFKIILGAKLHLKQLNPYDYCLAALNVEIKSLKEGQDPEHDLVLRCLNAFYQQTKVSAEYAPQQICTRSVLRIRSKVVELHNLG